MMDYFNILPIEITSDILARLPAEFVLDCKSVSKTWGNLIQHPSFYKMHVNHPRRHVDSDELGFLALRKDKTPLYYFEYIENHEKPIDRIRGINLTPPLKCDKVLGSFNGLICLYEWSDRFCICNPLIKEYVCLPELMQKPSCVGFGYLPPTNEYKIVRVHELKTEPNLGEVMVYTLGSRSGWRNIGKFSLKFNHCAYLVNGIFADGALHWMDREGLILVFDLSDENFRAHILPPPLSETGSSCCIGVVNGLLNGLLYYAQIYYDSPEPYLGLWLHIKKNVNYDTSEVAEHQSLGWTEEFTLYEQVFAYTKSGSLLAYGHTCVNIYNSEGETPKLLVDLKKPIHEIFSHKNTLVSLKDLGEENAKIINSSPKIKKQSGCD